MKEFLAVTLVMMMIMASGLAQTAKHSINSAAGRKAASHLKVAPAISASGVTAGFIPVFTDAAGDLGNSSLFMSGANLGFGTMTPSYNLHFISQTDPAAIAIDGYGMVGINFIGRRAEGTLASPSALLTNDNIMSMQGRGYGTTAFSPYSRAFMKFFAAENWTNAAQGTYITLATTTKGTSPSASATERVRITDAGFVGIGTTAPTAPLTVNGAVQSLTGGYVFPDSSVQITAALPGVLLTSPDRSLTVGGSAVAPTVAVNTASIQKRVSGTCAAGSAVTTVNADGSVVCGSTGSGSPASVPVIVAQTSFTGSYGLGSSQSIYLANEDAFYRVSVYMNIPTLGSCATAPCAGEAITLQWNDGVSSTALATASCNLVTPCGSSVVTPIWVKSGQTITAYGQSYGAGATPSGGTYNAYVLVEQMKK